MSQADRTQEDQVVIPTTNRFPSIFVSHSHHDNAFCRAFVRALREQGADVWYDESDLTEGELLRKIQPEVYSRPVFVVVLSEHIRAAAWVSRESRWGYLSYEDYRQQRRFLPVTGAPLVSDDFGPDWLFLRDFYRIEGANRTPLSPREAARRVLAEISQIHQLRQSANEGKSQQSEELQPAPLEPLSVASSPTGEVAPTFTMIPAIEHPASENSIPHLSLSVGPPLPSSASPHHSTPRIWRRTVFTLIGLAVLLVSIVGSFIAYSNFGVLHSGDLRWRYKFATNGFAWIDSNGVDSTGIIYVRTAFAGNNEEVDALRASNGSLAWNSQGGDPASGCESTSLTVSRDVIYVGSGDGYVYALHTNDGSVAWSFDTGDCVFENPVVANDMVYIVTGAGGAPPFPPDEYIYALHTSDGSLAWKYQTGGGIVDSPTVMSGIAYVGSDDGYVYALHTNDGSLAWKYQTGCAVNTSPASIDGWVYAATNPAVASSDTNECYAYALRA